MFKIGILLPRSTVYPLIGYDFLDGFKTYLIEFGLNDKVEVTTENIGFGLDEAEVYSKNEELILKNNADIVIAFIDGRYAEMLQPLYFATGKILILVNMGAYYPDIVTTNSNVIFLNYSIAFNSMLTGKLAASENKLKAIMATSFYDGGYLPGHAMINRYLQLGGALVSNFVSHFKPSNFDITPIKNVIETSPETQTLLCLYSGDVSPLFYKEISLLQKTKELHLYVSPMMLDETLKTILGDEFTINNAKGYTAWYSQLDNQQNTLFKEKFEQQTNRQVGIFSLLGWEAGMLLQQINIMKEDGKKSTEIIANLTGQVLQSPRGWLKLDKNTNETYGPSYLITVQDNFDLSVKKCFENVEEDRTTFIANKPEGGSSGWRNTYLCS